MQRRAFLESTRVDVCTFVEQDFEDPRSIAGGRLVNSLPAIVGRRVNAHPALEQEFDERKVIALDSPVKKVSSVSDYPQTSLPNSDRNRRTDLETWLGCSFISVELELYHLSVIVIFFDHLFRNRSRDTVFIFQLVDMSALFSNSRLCHLPQSDDSIEVFKPSEFNKRYRPTIPLPPRVPFDTAGFKKRIDYCNTIRAHRNISLRLMGFIQDIKKQCVDLVQGKGSKKEREAKINKLRIDEDMLDSRFHEVHGPDGLCDTLMENAALMIEIRLKVEYGDYLAVSLAKLKEPKFEGFQWKIHPKLSWVDVGRLLKKEKAEMDRHLSSTNLPRPETPWLDDVNKAAQMLAIDEEQLIYEITWYGKRNEFCHSGIKRMIDEADFNNLADRIIADKKSLCAIFKGRPVEQIEMRNCISRIQHEWYRSCYLKNGKAQYALSDKGFEKQVRSERQMRAAGENY